MYYTHSIYFLLVNCPIKLEEDVNEITDQVNKYLPLLTFIDSVIKKYEKESKRLMNIITEKNVKIDMLEDRKRK